MRCFSVTGCCKLRCSVGGISGSDQNQLCQKFVLRTCGLDGVSVQSMVVYKVLDRNTKSHHSPHSATRRHNRPIVSIYLYCDDRFDFYFYFFRLGYSDWRGVWELTKVSRMTEWPHHRTTTRGYLGTFHTIIVIHCALYVCGSSQRVTLAYLCECGGTYFV